MKQIIQVMIIVTMNEYMLFYFLLILQTTIKILIITCFNFSLMCIMQGKYMNKGSIHNLALYGINHSQIISVLWNQFKLGK